MVTLASLRKVQGLSTIDVAEHMGVTRWTVYAWERGQRAISAYDLEKLMKLYKADLPISQISTLMPRQEPNE